MSTRLLLATQQRVWIIALIVLAFAAVLRFWQLTNPTTLVFDELYYVRDAYSQLVHGYVTKWPDDEVTFGAAAAENVLSDPSYIAHPPLGKWLISLGIMLFGVEGGLGWRFATAVAGVLTVALTMLLAWLMTKRAWVMVVAGVLLSVEGLHVTLSRVSLLDGYLTLFIVVGALCVWMDHEWARKRWGATRASASRFVIWWWRPWLLVAACVFGLAAGIKWSGVYALAGFLIITLVQDIMARRRLRARFVWLQSSVQVAVQFVQVIALTVASYLATWAGWIITDGGWGRGEGSWFSELIDYHAGIFTWHLGLDAEHSFASNPLSWPLSLRPTGMHFSELDNGTVIAISPLPNVVVTWGGVLALIALIVLMVAVMTRKPRALVSHPTLTAASFILAGYLSGWLPWVLTVSRSAVFQFYIVVASPFLALALALVLAIVGERVTVPLVRFSAHTLRDRRIAVGTVIGAAVVLGLLFWPMWVGMPQAEWFWKLHRWLPGWY